MRGWSAIEAYLQKHDSGKVKDYADDIDTLLVFVSYWLQHNIVFIGSSHLQAGLFSAILTAFVVESYTILQPDGTQITNQLLADISIELRGGNVTKPTPPVASFTPTTAARWINALFFLSLVLSLTAALFTLLVKVSQEPHF